MPQKNIELENKDNTNIQVGDVSAENDSGIKIAGRDVHTRRVEAGTYIEQVIYNTRPGLLIVSVLVLLVVIMTLIILFSSGRNDTTEQESPPIATVPATNDIEVPAAGGATVVSSPSLQPIDKQQPSTDTPNLKSIMATATNPAIVDLSVSLTNGVVLSVPGQKVIYTIVINNQTSSSVTSVSVIDTFPNTLLDVTWSCLPGVGSYCHKSIGTGHINILVDLAADGFVSLEAIAIINTNASGTLINSVSVFPPNGVEDQNTSNNLAIDSDILKP